MNFLSTPAYTVQHGLTGAKIVRGLPPYTLLETVMQVPRWQICYYHLLLLIVKATATHAMLKYHQSSTII